MDKMNIYRGNALFAFIKVTLSLIYDGKSHKSVELEDATNITVSGQLGGTNVGEYTCSLIPAKGYNWDEQKNGWTNIEKDNITLKEGFNELYLKEITDNSKRYAIKVTLKINPQPITVDLSYKDLGYNGEEQKLIQKAFCSKGSLLYSFDEDAFTYDVNGIKSDEQYYKNQYIKDKVSDAYIYEIYGYKLNNNLYNPDGTLYNGNSIDLFIDNNIINIKYPTVYDANKTFYGKLVDTINNEEYTDGNINYFIPWENMQKYVDITFSEIYGSVTDTFIFFHTFEKPLKANKYYYFDLDILKGCKWCNYHLRANYPINSINKYWDNNIGLWDQSIQASTDDSYLLKDDEGNKYYDYSLLWFNEDINTKNLKAKANKLIKLSYDIKNIWYHLSGDDWETFENNLKNGQLSHNVWSSEIPSKKDVANYKIYYRTTTINKNSLIEEEHLENENYSNNFGNISVNINKYKLSVNDLEYIPQEVTIVYNTLTQNLVNIGGINNLEIYYRIKGLNEWSLDIPSIATPDKYIIEFYIKAIDENYIDSDIYELYSEIIKYKYDKNGVYVFPDYQNINTFIIENNILPEGFTLLNNLDCDGTFFFDLGFELFDGINIELNIRPIKPTENVNNRTTYWRGIFGVYTDNGDNDTGYGLYTTNYTKNPWYIAMNNFGYTNSSLYKIYSYHTYNIKTNIYNLTINDETCEDPNCHIDDKSYSLDINELNPNNRTCYLLSVNSEVPVNPFIGKFYNMNVYNDKGVLIHKYVPCKSNIKYYTVNEHTTIDNVTIGKYYISQTEYFNLTNLERVALEDYIDKTVVYLDGIFDMITRKFIEEISINKYDQAIQNTDRYLTFDNLSYDETGNGKLNFDIYNYNTEELTFLYGLYDITSDKYYGLTVETFEGLTGYKKSIEINQYLQNGIYDIVPVCQIIGSSIWNSTLSITSSNDYNKYWHVIKRSITQDNNNKFIITIESKSKDYSIEVDSYDDSSYDNGSYDNIHGKDLDIEI